MSVYELNLDIALSTLDQKLLKELLVAATNVLIANARSENELDLLVSVIAESQSQLASQVLENRLGGVEVQALNIEDIKILLEVDCDETVSDPQARRFEDFESKLHGRLSDRWQTIERRISQALDALGDLTDDQDVGDFVALVLEAFALGPAVEARARQIAHERGIPFERSYLHWRRKYPDAPANSAASIFFLDQHFSGLDVSRLVGEEHLRALEYGRHEKAIGDLLAGLKAVRGYDARMLERQLKVSKKACRWASTKLQKLGQEPEKRLNVVREAQEHGVRAPTVWINYLLEREILHTFNVGRKTMLSGDKFRVEEALGALVSSDVPKPISGEPLSDELLRCPIEKLNLTKRTLKILLGSEIITLGDLLAKSQADLVRTPGIGRASFNEVVDRIAAIGLSLGMEPASTVYVDATMLSPADRLKLEVQAELARSVLGIGISMKIRRLLKERGLDTFHDVLSLPESDTFWATRHGEQARIQIKEYISDLSSELGVDTSMFPFGNK